jgi:hypothetical protein
MGKYEIEKEKGRLLKTPKKKITPPPKEGVRVWEREE